MSTNNPKIQVILQIKRFINQNAICKISEVVYNSIFDFLHQLSSSLNLSHRNFLVFHHCDISLMNSIFLKYNRLHWFLLVLSHLFFSLFFFFTSDTLSLLQQTLLSLLLRLNFSFWGLLLFLDHWSFFLNFLFFLLYYWGLLQPSLVF